MNSTDKFDMNGPMRGWRMRADVEAERDWMADIKWQPLPPLWPDPAVWTDVGDFMLLVFTPDDVPTWEVRHKTKTADGGAHDLIVCGTADTFEAAKSAALFEARTCSSE